MEERMLARLAAEGFRAVPASHLGELGHWCRDWCAETGDARYCFLADTLDALHEWWSEKDKYGGVDVQLAERIDQVLQGSLQSVLHEREPLVAVRYARSLTATLRQIVDEEGPNPRAAARVGEAPVTGTAAAAGARILVGVGAISFRTAPFYRFTSGVESPVYVDNRRLLSFLDERTEMLRLLRALLLAEHQRQPFDLVAGTATAGIPWASWLAADLGLPLVYVRSSAKEWGQGRSIEGHVEEGQRALLVEDLAFTAGSLARAAAELRQAGVIVDDCVALVTYRAAKAQETLDAARLRLHTVTTIDDALHAAYNVEHLDEAQVLIVQEWLRGVRAVA